MLFANMELHAAYKMAVSWNSHQNSELYSSHTTECFMYTYEEISRMHCKLSDLKINCLHLQLTPATSGGCRIEDPRGEGKPAGGGGTQLPP